MFAFHRDAGDGRLSSTVPHRGWIYHERVRVQIVPYPGAGFHTTQMRERWWVVDDVCRSREIWYPFLATRPVETSIDESPGSIDVSIYDPMSGTAYTGQGTCGSTGIELGDAAERFRTQTKQGIWRRSGTMEFRGRLAYKLLPASYYAKTVMYVDAKTFQPLRWVG